MLESPKSLPLPLFVSFLRLLLLRYRWCACLRIVDLVMTGRRRALLRAIQLFARAEAAPHKSCVPASSTSSSKYVPASAFSSYSSSSFERRNLWTLGVSRVVTGHLWRQQVRHVKVNGSEVGIFFSFFSLHFPGGRECGTFLSLRNSLCNGMWHVSSLNSVLKQEQFFRVKE